MINPSDYGLDHDSFRKNQLATILWLKQQTGNVILEAPTGSGKTGIVKALSRWYNQVALVKTKLLQVNNYANYGYRVLLGKSNYACKNSGTLGLSCEDCIFDSMYDCPIENKCAYLEAKRAALDSRCASLNYAYWLTTGIFKGKRQIVVMDEAHLLPEIVLGYVGITLDSSTIQKYGLPELPRINARKKQVGLGRGYLLRCKNALNFTATRQPENRQDIERLLNKVGRALEQINSDWYISTQDGRFRAKPFTARQHFRDLFLYGTKSNIMMSATIGNADVFSSELGMADFVFRSVANQYPPETRPIFDLGCPAMTYKSSTRDKLLQARIICKAIEAQDTQWSGVILVNSKSQAFELGECIARFGLQDRLWIEPELSTNYVLEKWIERKAQVPNSIMLAWNLWEGVDLLDDKILIIAKIPYASLADEYQKLRMYHNKQFYQLQTAWKTLQGCGRIRRGRKEDYVRGNNFVAIADGCIHKLEKYLGDSFMESLEEF